MTGLFIYLLLLTLLLLLTCEKELIQLLKKSLFEL